MELDHFTGMLQDLMADDSVPKEATNLVFWPGG